MRVGSGGILTASDSSTSERQNEDSPQYQDIYLGLIHFEGSATANVVSEAVRNQLLSFGVGISRCFSATTDGDRTMKSAVSMLRFFAAIALHGLHNALKEVLKMDSL